MVVLVDWIVGGSGGSIGGCDVRYEQKIVGKEQSDCRLPLSYTSRQRSERLLVLGELAKKLF